MKTPREVLGRILEVLDLLEIPYLIGGSVASSTHRISRPTLDDGCGLGETHSGGSASRSTR